MTRGLLSRSLAETIAVETVIANTRFGSVAASSGRVPEADVLRVLAHQTGVPAVDLPAVAVPRAALDKVPHAVAKQHVVLPLAEDGDNLLLAMANPRDQKTIDEIGFATGLKVRPHVALHLRLLDAIAKAYANRSEVYEGPRAKGAKPGALVLVVDVPAAPPVSAALSASDPIEFEIDLTDEPLELVSGASPPRHGPATAVTAAATAAPAPRLSDTPAAAAVTVGRKVILVVDDEPEIQTLVVEALKSLGHELVAATRGAEALQLVKNRRPDLIILDAMLPEVHGFEICRKVKESKRFGSTPVLMVSAIYRGWRIAEDIKALYGVDSFLEKPFRINELRRQTEALLAKTPLKVSDDQLNREAVSQYDAGVKAYQANDHATAFKALRAAETIEPFSAKIQFMLGRVLEQQGRAFQAIYHYERAIELDQSLFAATKNLALLYQAKGFRNKAVEMWERCLKAAPTAEIQEQIKQHLVSIL
ncbi:MAG: response regulator [Deltaproteobacteria bacterium]|nr:response regulator [Deltaproteobacteria bacterium]